MPEPPIAISEIWNSTTCVRCHKAINKGEPRVVLMFADLGIGPGFRSDFTSDNDDAEEIFVQSNAETEEDEDDEDDPHGLRAGLAIALCGPCSGEDPTITISNPWFEDREARRADDPGGSVRAIPMTDLRIPHDDIDSDPLPEDHPRSAARNEAEDRFLSARADDPILPKLTQDDQRYRMQRFLSTPAAGRLRHSMRQVLQLWAEGRKQDEIAAETKISQATVSRIIRDGKSLLYSQRQKIA